MMKPQFDPITGEEFPAFDTTNTDFECDEAESDECVYGLRAQGIQSEIIVNFMNYVEMAKLQLLSRIDHNNIDTNKDFMENEQLPHLQTGFLIEEVGNVSVKTLSNGRLGMEQTSKSIDKDRVSALIYLLYYLEKYENNIQQEKSDVSGYLIYRSPVIRR